MDFIARIINPFNFLLRPFAKLIPSPVEKLIIFWLGSEECYDVVFRKVDFVLNPNCLTLVITLLISSFLVLISSSMKLPQIYYLVKTKSTQSVSVTAYIIESITDVIHTSFSYRSGYFMGSYVESSLITLQNIVITMLILIYNNKRDLSAAFVAIISVFASIIINPSSKIIDHWSLLSIQRMTFPLPVVGKAAQVYRLWKSGSNGQLSGTAVIYYLVTSVGRLIIIRTSDSLFSPVTLIGFILDSTLAYLYIKNFKLEEEYIGDLIEHKYIFYLWYKYKSKDYDLSN